GFPVVDETPEFEAAVEQETQAKVDANHPDGIADTSTERIHGVTLEQEERIRAREAELEHISAQAELGTQDGREQRTREVAAHGSKQRRRKFKKRAASVNPRVDPDRDDPRTELSQDELATVNTEANRLATRLDGWSRAAISRRLADAVVNGRDLTSAVVGVFEELQTAPGQVVPIGKLDAVDRKEVSIDGRVKTLWDPSHPSIAQVGLIADESGHTRVTIW
ncbi:DNA-binding protein, partial [Halorubrum sp. SP3]